MKLTNNKMYNQLINNITNLVQRAKENAFKAINNELIKANWEIGRYIVEYEQKGKEKAVYGSSLLSKISKDLKYKNGNGFSKSSIYLCRQFYIKYPIFQTLSGKLSWSHYSELLTVSDDLARSFYEKQSIKENWSFRELKRQIKTALFQRLALSKDKKGVLALANKGQEIASPKDTIKDPYIFEFYELPKGQIIKERTLERKLIDNLQKFLLELGNGFSFVARQHKITIDNEHYYIDLVFYHRILKCFVLIDLKSSKVKHQDIGQMNLYLNYFKDEENVEGDNDPIGIIIAADKNEFLVKYATGGLSNKIFVSKYQLYLPDKKLLENKVKEILND
ncbi:YhcG family protein [Candidatus Endomicrobiellum devescovinae]|uniref:PDDEXK nuclease domain-containing protein n=1 Tax=Candidatus Endomicrobiellum devescovinae TaxID=3242322 RepID=UPI00283A3D3B|nr:PDDEXK nuclease domain-containing protein [Endomicrobium sp.]MDR1434454.1 PDDEXK nuclease domain-containing protein [Endomicrobium sp.]MDR2818422.1 PDDEXK nuclease domain-containing protein [Endomicrobium sp.]